MSDKLSDYKAPLIVAGTLVIMIILLVVIGFISPPADTGMGKINTDGFPRQDYYTMYEPGSTCYFNLPDINTDGVKLIILKSYVAYDMPVYDGIIEGDERTLINGIFHTVIGGCDVME